VALTLAGCSSSADDPFDGGRLLRSTHFAYHAFATDEAPCNDTLVELENDFSRVQAFVGFGWPSDAVVDYWKYPSNGAKPAICAVSNSCTERSSVHSRELIHLHELIHAYLYPTGSPPSFLREGLAEALSCERNRWTADERAGFGRLTAAALASWDAEVERDFAYYHGSTQLVRYLIETFGVGAVLDSYAKLHKVRDPTAVQAVVSSVFGDTFDGLWQKAGAMDLPGGPCLHPYQCATNPVEIGGSPFTVAHRCGVAREFAALDVPVSATLLVRKAGPFPFWFDSCDGKAAHVSGAVYDHTPQITVGQFEAGRYSIGHPVPAAPEMASIAIEIPSKRSISSVCQEAAASPLEPGDAAVEIDLRRDGATAYVALRFAAPTPLDLFFTSPGSANPVLCRTCGETTESCVPFASGFDPPKIVVAEGDYIVVAPTIAETGSYTQIKLQPSPPP
jgi:hypothetical protein